MQEYFAAVQQHPSIADLINPVLNNVLEFSPSTDLNHNTLVEMFEEVDDETTLVLSTYFRNVIDTLSTAIKHLEGIKCVATERKNLLDTIALIKETINASTQTDETQITD